MRRSSCTCTHTHVMLRWGGVGWLITFKYTSTHTVMLRYCTFFLHLHTHVMLRYCTFFLHLHTHTHTRHATLLHVLLALAHIRHATLLHVLLALAHTHSCGNTYTSSSTDITRRTRPPRCSGWKTTFASFCTSGPWMMIHTKHCKYQVTCSILIDFTRVLRRRVTLF